MGLLSFFIGFLKRIFKLLVYFTVVVAVVLVIPNLPPYTKFSYIETVLTKERAGGLKPNTILNNAAKLYDNVILGPENFQIFRGELYTSLATGEIVKYSPGGHITFVTKIGQTCTGLSQEHICGRPLGFIIDEKYNLLYVADAYYGIWKVDLKTDKKQVLVSADTVIEGRIPRLFNSLVIDKTGSIYFTDSSSDYLLKDGVFSTLSDPKGRLIHHNPATKENKVLVDNIWFANGVTLSPDESFIVIAETMKYRVLKHYISGPKIGKTEVFVDGLPGMPDNLRALPDGSGLQIAMYAVATEDMPIVTKSLSGTPLIRKFISRVAHLVEIPFSYLNRQFPHWLLEEIEYSIGSFKSIASLTDETGLIVTDWDGNIIISYYNTDKSVVHISDAIVYNNKLLLGAPHTQNYIGVVDVPPLLKQAYTVKAQKHLDIDPTSEKKPVVQETPKHKATTQTKASTQKAETKQTTQKPETKPTAQKPETKPATQKPETKPTTQKPKTSPSTQIPETKPTTQKPETKPPIQKPGTIPTTQKPETIPTTQKPETKPTTQKLETKPTNQKPEPKPTTQKPETKPPTQKPATKPTTQKPETKPTTQKPETKSTTQKPEPKPTTQKPETKPTTQKPETKPTIQKPESKPTTQKPEIKPMTQKSETERNTPIEKVTISPAKKVHTEPSKESVKNIEIKQKNVETKPLENKKETKKAPNHIPIEEEIVSDTAKPSKDKLKVIKKSGPEEIPNPI